MSEQSRGQAATGDGERESTVWKPRTPRLTSAAPPDTYELPLALRLRPVLDLSEDQFFELCQINGDILDLREIW